MPSKDSAAMGAFLVGGLFLFGLGLFLIGDRRMLFSKSTNYSAEFAQVSSLEEGAKVRVGGLDAGELVGITVPSGPRSKFLLHLRVVDKFAPVIRTDSVVSIATDGLLGSKFLLIDIGTTGQAPPGFFLPTREPFEIADLLAKIRETVDGIDHTFGDVKGDVAEAAKTVADSAKHIDEIIVSGKAPLQRVMMAVSQMSEDVSVLIARVKAGEGALGKFVNDDEIYNLVVHTARDAQQAVGNLRQTTTDAKDLVSRVQNGSIPEDVEKTVKNLTVTTERLKTLVAGFQPTPGGGDGVAGELRATLSNAREAMSDLAENLEALKHGFFFRGFFKDRGFYDLGNLSPAEYQSKEFEKNVTKERAWMQQDQLFALSDGSEQLTDSGRKKLDGMMVNFLRFTADRAVIVEGYAGAGSPDEQFLQSRERAVKVRDYLIKKFTLNPGYVGVMPMGAVKGFGDGIALVLLKK